MYNPLENSDVAPSVDLRCFWLVILRAHGDLMTPEPYWFQLVFLEIAEYVRPFEDMDVALESYYSLDDFDLETSHDLVWY